MSNNIVPTRYHFDLICEEGPDGSKYLRTTEALPPFDSRVTSYLEKWARLRPDRPFLARRAQNGWQELSYGDAMASVKSIGQALLDRGLQTANPVLILSGNGIEHALLALACMHVGVIYCPVTAAYSLASRDFTRLRDIVELIQPSLVFVDDAAAYGRAVSACVPPETEVVAVSGDAGRPTTTFSDLVKGAAGPAIDLAAQKIAPHTVAKLLFTSGSTGFPKAVIATHQTMSNIVQMLLSRYDLPEGECPVLVDWLPWSHVLGGTCSFGVALYKGGTLYIDNGGPLSSQIETTVSNLREISPTLYCSVPRGYESLVPCLRQDQQLRENFFSRVRILQYSGAAMAQHVCDAIDELALATTGARVSWLSVFGSTEAGLIASHLHSEGTPVGRVGLPAPGAVLKLAPVDGSLEGRVQSAGVTPGYWKRPDLTSGAFDANGFFHTGDAVDWVDPMKPADGLCYVGRTAEDFKLATGTWVRVGLLRADLIKHLSPEVRDVVIVGENRDYIAVLGIPASQDVLHDSKANDRLASKLRALAQEAPGSARRVQRFVFLTDKLSIDDGEVTDKGVLNQRAIARRHTKLIKALYSDVLPEDGLVVLAD